MKLQLPLITPEFSLYAHSDKLIDHFNQLLCTAHDQLPLYNNAVHVSIDYIASIFNYWVQLIQSPEIRIAKVDRVVLHDLTIKVNEYVAKNELIHEFRARFRSHHEIFVLASFIAHEVLRFINEITPHHLLAYYNKIKLDEPYYILTNSDLDRPEIQAVFEFRRKLAGQLTEIPIRRRLNAAIYNAIKQTRQLLTKQQST